MLRTPTSSFSSFSVLGSIATAAFEAVQDGQHLSHDPLGGPFDHGGHLSLGSLAIVLEVGRDPAEVVEVLVGVHASLGQCLEHDRHRLGRILGEVETQRLGGRGPRAAGSSSTGSASTISIIGRSGSASSSGSGLLPYVMYPAHPR